MSGNLTAKTLSGRLKGLPMPGPALPGFLPEIDTSERQPARCPL